MLRIPESWLRYLDKQQHQQEGRGEGGLAGRDAQRCDAGICGRKNMEIAGWKGTESWGVY